MKSLRTATAVVLMLALIFLGAPRFSASGAAHAGQEVALAPAVSEGIELNETEEGSSTVLAHVGGSLIVFEETKTLSFTVTYGDGWLPCSRYSRFFPNDGRATVTQTGAGVYEYRFEAEEGGSVQLSEWESAHIYASASRLPKLCIDTEVDFDDIDRDNWVDATFTLTLGTKEFASGDYEGTGAVKGRGNSSWTYPKKPYSIKLSSKASLLDIPKTKKYAIIPGYHDGSLMRNYITYKIWQGLYGIGYVPKCEFVDVYLNGEYNGIYTLVERIDIEKSKIDIAEADADNLTGGYLIEKDVAQKIDFSDDLWFNCPYWANQSKDYFVLKAPEPEDDELKAAMRGYLEEYMQRVHDSIMGISGEAYTDYVDTSSWVDFIIVQEIAKNIDGNFKSSCYMYKDRDDDHLYMTALWDFDFAYGRVTWNNQSEEHNDVYDCPNADTPDGYMIVNSSNPWMDRLYDTVPEFREALYERYTAYRYMLVEDMFTMIEEQAAYLDVVQEPNYQLWHKNFHTGVSVLKSWLTERIEWLDGEWLVEEPVYELGDINMDGVVDAQDALLAMRYALGLIELEDEAVLIGDMDGDGALTSIDALMLMRLAMGLGG